MKRAPLGGGVKGVVGSLVAGEVGGLKWPAERVKFM